MSQGTIVVGATENAFVYGPALLDVDCNANGNPDECDIAMGMSTDRNGNGVPDECEPCLLADFNGDERVSFSDILILFGFWGLCAGDCAPDLDQDGQVGFSDLLMLLSAWGPCN